LIAMRFHAIIVGLISNVKTLAINYDIKVEKIASEFELPILELHKDFKNQFEQLEAMDVLKNQAKVNLKKFDWSGFEKVINQES
jgi:polysaccharide pyruvyl transferase WcaK-like protein